MKDSPITRRSFVAGAVMLPALAGLLLAETTTAQAKASQAQLKYQSTPKNDQKCSGCRFFVAGKTSSADGTCQIVEGSISPNGWCTGWVKKSS
jgi:High potential iron-sulfur protein